MTKTQAVELVRFISDHYDSVSQEDYFELCDMIIQIVVHDANQQGYGAALVKECPNVFEME